MAENRHKKPPFFLQALEAFVVFVTFASRRPANYDRIEPMKKRNRAALVCVCAVAAFILVTNMLVVSVAKSLIVSSDEALAFSSNGGADCILVLGASVSQYGPSPMLADRLDRGIELFDLGVSNIMLLSGDNGTIEYNEVQAMKDYVLRQENTGAGAANIYLDYAGFSTYNSVVRCKEIFEAKRVVIVTQRYHLYRAVYNAKKAGLDVVGVAAVDTKYGGQTVRNIREVPARVKDFLLSLVGYTPKIMGDPVPLVYPSTQQ